MNDIKLGLQKLYIGKERNVEQITCHKDVKSHHYLYKKLSGKLNTCHSQDVKQECVNWNYLYEDIINPKCLRLEKHQPKGYTCPIYVVNINLSSSCKTYNSLVDYLCTSKNATLWRYWLQRNFHLQLSEAQNIVCKHKENVAKKYLKWWKRIKDDEYKTYFSKYMMDRNVGIKIKSVNTEINSMYENTSCDVSELVKRNLTKNTVTLSPGNIELNVDNIHILPPFPSDEDFLSTSSKSLLNKGWIIKLKQTQNKNFQLLIRYSPPPFQTYRVPGAENRMCGIDLGVCHFATIFDPDHGVFCVDVNTSKTFKRGKVPNVKELYKFDEYMAKCHSELTNYLVRNYSLVVIGNLSVYKDDYKKNFNLALKMEHFWYTLFRNLLIRKAYPRYETRCTVVTVDEFRTSKICSCCQFYDKEITFKGSTFVCRNCKCKINRDGNAAKNILNRFLNGSKYGAVLQCS
jgi:transposase